MSAAELFSGPACQRLTWTLVHFLWQGLAVAAAVAALLWLLRTSRTPARYGLCLAGILVMALCPAATFLLQTASMPARRPVDTQKASDRAGPPTFVPYRQTREMPKAPPDFDGGAARRQRPLAASYKVPAYPPQAAASRWQLQGMLVATQPYLLLIWLAGVMLLGGRLLMAVVGVRMLMRDRRPVGEELRLLVVQLSGRLGLRAVPRAFVSRKVREAVVVGLLRPLVLLPAAWLIELTPEVLEAVLAHELAHIRRWDLWANLVQRLVETFLFYHPAVWWLSRRMSLERGDVVADEAAVAATGERCAAMRRRWNC